MDGMTALPRLLERDPGLKIIMSSTLTRDGADVTVRALGMGAADYIPKPTSRSELHSSSDYRGQLIEKVKALGSARRQRRDSTAARAAAPAAAPGLFRGRTISLRRYPAVFNPAVVAIGSSTGGPQALLKVFEVLGTKVRLPIFITQHMPATFTTILAEHLSARQRRPCRRGRRRRAGRRQTASILRPAISTWTVASEAGKKIIRLNQQPPENFCRPAVDVMLRSMVEVYGGSILSVILTGMGYDGLKSSEGLVEAGGVLLAQDEDTSVVLGDAGRCCDAGACATRSWRWDRWATRCCVCLMEVVREPRRFQVSLRNLFTGLRAYPCRRTRCTCSKAALVPSPRKIAWPTCPPWFRPSRWESRRT